MAVYTVLDLAQVQQFGLQYDVTVTAIQPISGGVENTSYFVSSLQGEYVLTLFEVLTFTAAQRLPPVLDFLAQHHLPVANPLKSKGQPILTLLNKPVQLAPRLEGDIVNTVDLAQVDEMGAKLAQMHLALKQFSQRQSHLSDQFPVQVGAAWWQAKLVELAGDLTDYQQQVMQTLIDRWQQKHQQYSPRQGLIHCDLFRDNCLFLDGKMSGMLDFSELSHGAWLYDIAITMNDFCSDWPLPALDLNKANQFLKQYQQYNPLDSVDLANLPLYLAWAASEFWLSRLQHAKNQASGTELVSIKDYDVMWQMMLDRLEMLADNPFL